MKVHTLRPEPTQPKPSKSTNQQTHFRDSIKIFAFLNPTYPNLQFNASFWSSNTEVRSDETKIIQIYKSTHQFSRHCLNFCFPKSKLPKSTNQHIFLMVHSLRPEPTQPKQSKSINQQTNFRDTIKIFAFLNPTLSIFFAFLSRDPILKVTDKSFRIHYYCLLHLDSPIQISYSKLIFEDP